jgi:hypothetical protein
MVCLLESGEAATHKLLGSLFGAPQDRSDLSRRQVSAKPKHHGVSLELGEQAEKAPNFAVLVRAERACLRLVVFACEIVLASREPCGQRPSSATAFVDGGVAGDPKQPWSYVFGIGRASMEGGPGALERGRRQVESLVVRSSPHSKVPIDALAIVDVGGLELDVGRVRH